MAIYQLDLSHNALSSARGLCSLSVVGCVIDLHHISDNYQGSFSLIIRMIRGVEVSWKCRFELYTQKTGDNIHLTIALDRIPLGSIISTLSRDGGGESLLFTL